MPLILKMAHRVPELMIRAMAGDPTAIFLLTAMGFAVGHEALKNFSKDKK